MVFPLIQRLARLLAVACLALGFCSNIAAAQQAEIFAVAPPGVNQGDTIMLTILGKYLPTGTVVVEFFPQQIAVLDVLSATSEEILVQIKVPSLASPGSYNMLIYNHLGQEAFGEGVLMVGSDLVTPIFDDYDPKQISSATDGFALMLTGSLITQDAVSQLKMVWEQAGKRISGITTAFAMAGTDTVVCAVSGRLRNGVLRGRVLMGDTPIYFVEVTLAMEGPVIVGHTPSVLPVMQESYTVQLLGTDFTPLLADSMSAELNTENISVKAAGISLKDESSIQVNFAGPLPAGLYNIEAIADGRVAYSGEISLLFGEDPDESVVEPGNVIPSMNESDVVAESEDSGQSEDLTVDEPETEVTDQPDMFEGTPLVHQFSVAATNLPAGNNPVRIDVDCPGVTEAEFEQLIPELLVNDEQAELLLVSTGSGSFTYVFTPDTTGWQDGEIAELLIHDPDTAVTVFTTSLAVQAAESQTAAVEDDSASLSSAESEPERELRVLAVTANPGTTWMELLVKLELPAEMTASDIIGEYSLLPAESQLLDCFSNISLQGELEFEDIGPGLAQGRAPGVFVRGDLLVKLGSEGRSAVLNSLPLAAPAVSVNISKPRTQTIMIDPDSGLPAPAWLSWDLDFGLLTPSSSNVIQVVTTPAVPETDILVVSGADTQIDVEVELDAISYTLVPDDEFWVSFESPCELEWSEVPQFSFLITDETQTSEDSLFTPVAGGSALTAEGFTLRLEVDPGVDLTMLADLPLVESNLLLLQWNLVSFELTRQLDESDGTGILELRFTRDIVKINDQAYGYFAEELVESSPVGMQLSWPDQNLISSFVVSFTSEL